MRLNRIRLGAILIAGSGMRTGGRVRHHLRHNLAHADCSVIFVEFAARGSLARIIIDGAQSIKLFALQGWFTASVPTTRSSMSEVI